MAAKTTVDKIRVFKSHLRVILSNKGHHVLMKIKFLQGEFDFDRDDAAIVIPIILLLLSFATPLPKVWLIAGVAAYYVVLFFGGKLVESVKKWLVRRSYRCPHCKGRHTILLGLNNYLGDCPYYFYKCNDCGQESIDVGGTLVQPVKWKNLTSRSVRHAQNDGG